MDLRDTPEEAAFRAEVRGWLEANYPSDLTGPRSSEAEYERAWYAWSQKLAEAGYAGLTWPVGVRRQRRAVSAPGDLPRGDRARRGTPARGRHRPRHGRPDDHRARHRGAEGALPAEDPLGRGDLVPGLLRARRRLRPRVGADERAARRRPLRRRRPEGLVVVRPHRRLVHPRHPQRPRRRRSTRA